MKLIVISNNPSRASFRQRIGVYIDMLSADGIDCSVVKLPPRPVQRWRLFKSAARFDAVLLHKKCLNMFDAPILRRYAKVVIYDFDDAIMYSPARPDSDSGAHLRPFRRTAAMADIIIAGNSYLADHAGRFCRNVHILPTALNTTEYNSENIFPVGDGKIRLVWIGSKATLQYLYEIAKPLQQLAARNSNIVLRIICDEFFDIHGLTIEKCTWSLENQAAQLVCSDIGISPMPDDRFTRGKCGFKILQYFAAGLPVVASPVGINADLLKNSNAGFVASGATEWIENIQRLIDDAAMRRQMGIPGRSFVQRYDTKNIGREFCRLIKNAIGNSTTNKL